MQEGLRGPAIVVDGSLPSTAVLTPAGQELRVDEVVEFNVTYTDLGSGKEETRPQTWFSLEEFFRIQAGLIKARRKPPGTAQPAVGAFLEKFTALADKGHQEILVLVVPRSKSGTLESATEAVDLFHAIERYKEARVRIIETGTTASGTEFLAERAIMAREAGKSLDEIASELEMLRPNIEAIIALPTLMFVDSSGRGQNLTDEGSLTEIMKRRLGRLGKGLAARITRLAQRSPSVVFLFQEGVERPIAVPLAFDGAVNRLVTEVQERVEDPDREVKRIYLLHSQEGEELEKARTAIKGFYRGDILQRTEIPIALLAVTGPKLVAAFCIYE